MERKLGHFPNEEDLSVGFTPGVRFYFAYDRLAKHPRAVFDGVLPVKVRDGVKLEDWVDTIVIPEAYREEFEGLIPDGLCDRILYLPHEGLDIWHWSKKVYEAVRERSAGHD